jgi:hypothetical protein
MSRISDNSNYLLLKPKNVDILGRIAPEILITLGIQRFYLD